MPAIAVVDLAAPAAQDERVEVANARPAGGVDVAVHYRTTTGMARCGIPAKQDQMTDNGGHVTCRRCM